MALLPGREHFVLLDDLGEDSAELRLRLARLGEVVACRTLGEALAALEANPKSLGLLDTRLLAASPPEHVRRLVAWRGRARLGLVSADDLEAYIPHLRAWGLTQCLVKTPPVDADELLHFLAMVDDPRSGFGLVRSLRSTLQIHSVGVDSLPSKVAAIERVANHFATCGFDIHELYDVRLILEEATNNALFHAFHTASGEEKYFIGAFDGLGPDESVRIEYGSDADRVGFSVTDNSGKLRVSTIIGKLERQMSKQGVFDESGRGLYLSRLLTTRLLLNIEENRRTQLVAIFDATRRSGRPKPLLVNYVGQDQFDSWGVDPELEMGLEMD